jgi:hypothetical protein
MKYKRCRIGGRGTFFVTFFLAAEKESKNVMTPHPPFG